MATPFAGGLYITDTLGVPVPGALISTYEAGTTTPKAAFTTSALDVPETNPIEAGADGRAIFYLGAGTYDIRVTTSVAAGTVALPYHDQDDVSGESSDALADLASTSSASLGDALVGVKLVATGATARTQHDKNADFVTVKDFGAVGDGVADDAPAVQLAVADAILKKTNRIFFPFDRGETYRFGSTVTIEASGFLITGNAAPKYDITGVYAGGYIFANTGVTVLFDYGNDNATLPLGQFTCTGVAFASALSLANTQTAIKFSTDENGPHRGCVFRDVSATGFEYVAHFKPPTGGVIASASVIVENCVFRNNTKSFYAEERVFNFRFVGNQAEQTSGVSGNFDAGVTITDNMLEGQANPVNIDAPNPSVIFENNYLEAITGDYVVRVKGANAYTVLTTRPNFLQTLTATDIYRVEGVVRVDEQSQMSLDNASRKAQLATVNGCIFGPISNLAGRIYTDGVFTSGFCDPRRHSAQHRRREQGPGCSHAPDPVRANDDGRNDQRLPGDVLLGDANLQRRRHSGLLRAGQDRGQRVGDSETSGHAQRYRGRDQHQHDHDDGAIQQRVDADVRRRACGCR
jgi:hypothetical protein